MLNPFNQNYGHIQAIQSLLATVDRSNFISMVSFTKRCTFKVNPELRKIQSQDLIVYDIELTDFINRKLNILKLQNQSTIFSEEEVQQMYQQLDNENITDLVIRNNHIETLKSRDPVKDSTDIIKAEKATCKMCGKEVSEKVRVFCLSNQERFKGEIYCFEHQKR